MALFSWVFHDSGSMVCGITDNSDLALQHLCGELDGAKVGGYGSITQAWLDRAGRGYTYGKVLSEASRTASGIAVKGISALGHRHRP